MGTKMQSCTFIFDYYTILNLLGVIEYGLSILYNFLFAREYTSEHLYSVVLALQFKPPDILLLCAIHKVLSYLSIIIKYQIQCGFQRNEYRTS